MAYQPPMPYWQEMEKDQTSLHLSFTYGPLDSAYLRIFNQLYIINQTTSQEEFEPSEEEIRVFESIQQGKEKMTRQSAEELLKELKDMTDE
ncbi:MAG: hypothetical protein E6L03_09165 [Thaumarchaeota archaeon]|nr:MAG: hypothetical protein E6L03_09165 [Nitrososphaerota archaeon]